MERFGGDLFRIIYLKGMCSVFFSWWDILFRSTDSSFYLLNQFDLPKMTYTTFTAWFFFSKFSSSHEIMVEDAAGLDYIKGKVAKRAEESGGTFFVGFIIEYLEKLNAIILIIYSSRPFNVVCEHQVFALRGSGLSRVDSIILMVWWQEGHQICSINLASSKSVSKPRVFTPSNRDLLHQILPWLFHCYPVLCFFAIIFLNFSIDIWNGLDFNFIPWLMG